MAYIGFAPATKPLTANDLVDGVLTTAKIADGAVTTVKIQDLNVTTAKIADDNINTVKLANASVTTDIIANTNVRTADIGIANITSTLIADDNITTDKLQSLSVSTPKIQEDAIRSSKIAPLTNLQEDILITAAGVQDLKSNVTVNVLENSIRYFTSATTSNICVNIRGNDTTTLNSIMDIGNTISTAVLITNGGTPQFVGNTQVDNVLVVPKVQGGTAISSGNANATDIYVITVLKTADATFTMFLSQTQFA